MLPPYAPWEGPDLDSATCSLYDASLTHLLHRIRTQPREFCSCPCPTGILTSCFYWPRADQVVLWMLALAIALPQRARTDTKKMSSLSVPENPLPNAVLSGGKKQIHKEACSPLLFTPGCCSRGSDRGREGQQCPRKWVQDAVCYPTGEGFCTFIPSLPRSQGLQSA